MSTATVGRLRMITAASLRTVVSIGMRSDGAGCSCAVTGHRSADVQGSGSSGIKQAVLGCEEM